MTQEELDKVLEKHLHWLQEDCERWVYMRANLKDAFLKGANLKGKNLVCANLQGANLECANLKGSNLEGANLKGANLKGANIKGTNLKGANLEGAKNLPFIPIYCPDAGSFIGWKKARGKIIKLKIPADAKRCSATSEKCRCNKAKVLEIQETDGSISETIKIASNYDDRFIYEVGKTVYVKDFCEDRWRESSQGIHFFINRQSAVEY